MTLNATLVVQIINFGVTYLLFSSLFLWPAYRLLSAEYAHWSKIRRKIEEVTELVVLRESENKQVRVKLQNSLQLQQPALRPVEVQRPPVCKIKRVSALPQLKEIMQRVQQMIVREVKHG